MKFQPLEQFERRPLAGSVELRHGPSLASGTAPCVATVAVRPDVGSLDDDRLMALVAAGDSAAFRLLVDRHARTAQRIGYRMLGDAVEAEDVAQECLARLWQHAGRWKPGGPGVAAWVSRVAINLSLDRLRRRRPLSEESLPERADDAPLADALIDDERRRRLVVGCVLALNDRQRAAIVLTYYEGQPNIMAARALAMNIKAFESLLHRARQTLRASLSRAGLLGIDDGDGA